MDKLLKQAQRMQAQMTLAQQELEKTVVEGSAGGGMVKAKVNGQGDVISISISPEVVKPDEVDMLEDLVLTALKDAIEKSHKMARERSAILSVGVMACGGGGLPSRTHR